MAQDTKGQLTEKFIQTDYNQDFGDFFMPKCQIPCDQERRSSKSPTQTDTLATQASGSTFQLYSKECLEKISENRQRHEFSFNEESNKMYFRSSKQRTTKLRELINNTSYHSYLKAVKNHSPGPGAYNLKVPSFYRKYQIHTKPNNYLPLRKPMNKMKEIPNLTAVLQSRMLQGTKNSFSLKKENQTSLNSSDRKHENLKKNNISRIKTIHSRKYLSTDLNLDSSNQRLAFPHIPNDFHKTKPYMYE